MNELPKGIQTKIPRSPVLQSNQGYQRILELGEQLEIIYAGSLP